MGQIIVIDCETTGLEPESNSIVEFAAVSLDSESGIIQRTFSSLVKPLHPISLPAMATHHITERMVEDAPSLTQVMLEASIAMGANIATVCHAAHNAAFDSAFLPAFSPWLCTWRLAQHLWPDAPGHSNGVLRYWLLELNEELKNNTCGANPWPMQLPPHRALPDAWITAHVLRRMLRERPCAELMELSPKPILLKTVRFGKHRGTPWAEVPRDYLRWVAGQDFDPDTLATAKHYSSG